jgi:hypothetical protein
VAEGDLEGYLHAASFFSVCLSPPAGGMTSVRTRVTDMSQGI